MLFRMKYYEIFLSETKNIELFQILFVEILRQIISIVSETIRNGQDFLRSLTLSLSLSLSPSLEGGTRTANWIVKRYRGEL